MPYIQPNFARYWRLFKNKIWRREACPSRRHEGSDRFIQCGTSRECSGKTLKIIKHTIHRPPIDRKALFKVLQVPLEIVYTFTSGKVAERSLPQYAVFAAYAAGMGGATRNLALDLKPIRINQVNPERVLTQPWGVGAEARVEEAAKNALLGKLGRPEDTTETYICLMKDTTATGVVINNSGGEFLVEIRTNASHGV
ncbi:short-chain dehydrogenase, putative [Talaromyces stipitatus ATCC 10500]|uniref:Short-chain dehydrogenase, putative n=1 Tax=Talaromyces stipitatus (strain ATCC 10500 / CBS 375.48 / QM 6759 / NRRL 1006) TaxID=441959 RepID=B8MJB0_TALSN|nr:short-chain dehydrogenase, putative [Talaromyces stipitatus ATCC 10500]EED14699.1 short-chain dehydrogenase, putative [Talaromyces stipitatus ATCC 10500]